MSKTFRIAALLGGLGTIGGCGAPEQPTEAVETTVIRGGRTPAGAEITVAFRGDTIIDLDDAMAGPLRTIAADGMIVAPAFIDSHVHLSYYPAGDRLCSGGVAAAVDLAAPIGDLKKSERWIGSGPMLTRPGGYPTGTWGRNGYGWPCPDTECVESAVSSIAAAGGRAIKLALGPDGIPPELAVVAVAAAHRRELPVVAHALREADAALAARIGVDVLAHTPIEPLSEETVEALREVHVISTLAAFERPSTVDNLARLSRAGATVVYGTDLGNLRPAHGISSRELELLGRSGLSPHEIVAAATEAPAALWGLSKLGALTPGHRASLLVFRAAGPSWVAGLAAPEHVFIDGMEIRRGCPPPGRGPRRGP